MTVPNMVEEIALSELSPVKVYLDIITSSRDPEEVLAARDLYSSLFDIDPPYIKSWEDYTQRVSHSLSVVNGEKPKISPLQSAVYSLEQALSGKRAETYPPEEQLLNDRIHAITHLVRSMIQGNQAFPIERYSEVIDMCVDAIVSLDDSITPRKAKRHIKYEIKEIWEVRSVEALKLVGAPARSTVYKIGSSVVNFFRAGNEVSEGPN